MVHTDRPDPESVYLKNSDLAATPIQLLEELDRLGIEHYTLVHEPLFTVEHARAIVYDVNGAHTKNLFLRNKKGRMFLLVAERDQQVDLRRLRDMLQISGGQFAFASTERMAHYLGVVPGSVSALALYNDKECAVQVLMDTALLHHEWIYLHPCRNTHSTRIRVRNLIEILDAWDHPVLLLDFNSQVNE